MANNTTVKSTPNGAGTRVTYHQTEGHQPSWKLHKDGAAMLEIDTHHQTKYMRVIATEVDKTTNKRKQVFISLSPEDAQELMNQLAAAGLHVSDMVTR